jgi:uncharacterized membrane protein
MSLLLTGRVWPFLVAGLVAPGLARLGLYIGVHRVGASRASALASFAPLFAMTLAVLALGEQPGWGLMVGATAIVAGGVLLAYRHRDDRAWRRRDLVFPVLGALGFGIRDNLSRWGFAAFPHPLLAAAAATAASVAVMWAVVFAARGTGLVAATRLGVRLLALSGLAEGIAYLTMWRALLLGEVSVVSPLVNCHAIVTVALAWLFLRDLERVTWQSSRPPCSWSSASGWSSSTVRGDLRRSAAHRPNTWSRSSALTAVASTGPSGRRPDSLEMTSGPAAGSSVGRPCEPLTRLASRGITSIKYRKPRAFFASRQPIFAFGSRSAGSRNSSTGS